MYNVPYINIIIIDFLSKMDVLIKVELLSVLNLKCLSKCVLSYR
jgi:hypothetical protein